MRVNSKQSVYLDSQLCSSAHALSAFSTPYPKPVSIHQMQWYLMQLLHGCGRKHDDACYRATGTSIEAATTSSATAALALVLESLRCLAPDSSHEPATAAAKTRRSRAVHSGGVAVA